jgi:hypothetical protein
MSSKSEVPSDVQIQGSTERIGATVQMYRCKKNWNELAGTSHPEVRFCGECSRSVFRARDLEGYLQLAASDRCAFVDQGEMILGMPVSHYESGKPLVWDDQ